MATKLKLLKIYSLRKTAETFNRIQHKGLPLWTLAAIAVIGLGAVAAWGVPALLGSSSTPIRNPAFAGVTVEELPIEVNIEPENLVVDEETQGKLAISLHNPTRFDITKNMTLDYRCASWTSDTNVWGNFASTYTTLVTMPGVTVHPQDTVSFDVPFIFNTTTTNDENVTEGNKLLCQFKLSTATA